MFHLLWFTLFWKSIFEVSRFFSEASFSTVLNYFACNIKLFDGIKKKSVVTLSLYVLHPREEVEGANFLVTTESLETISLKIKKNTCGHLWMTSEEIIFQIAI